MSANAIHLTYKIDGSDFSSAGEASAAMKRVLRGMGVDVDTIRRCAICMYEGEINAFLHANGGRADVFIEENGVSIVIEDKGSGIEDVELAMREGYSTAAQNVRELGFGAGMGLPNMKKYSDSIKIDTEADKGTKVTMVILFPKPDEAAR